MSFSFQWNKVRGIFKNELFGLTFNQRLKRVVEWETQDFPIGKHIYGYKSSQVVFGHGREVERDKTVLLFASIWHGQTWRRRSRTTRTASAARAAPAKRVRPSRSWPRTTRRCSTTWSSCCSPVPCRRVRPNWPTTRTRSTSRAPSALSAGARTRRSSPERATALAPTRKHTNTHKHKHKHKHKQRKRLRSSPSLLSFFVRVSYSNTRIEPIETFLSVVSVRPFCFLCRNETRILTYEGTCFKFSLKPGSRKSCLGSVFVPFFLLHYDANERRQGTRIKFISEFYFYCSFSFLNFCYKDKSFLEGCHLRYL